MKNAPFRWPMMTTLHWKMCHVDIGGLVWPTGSCEFVLLLLFTYEAVTAPGPYKATFAVTAPMNFSLYVTSGQINGPDSRRSHQKAPRS